MRNVRPMDQATSGNHDAATPPRPIIGIAPDLSEPRPGRLRAEVGLAYAQAIWDAGGMPLILPPIVELIPEQLFLCRGWVLTGGDDPSTEPFGAPTHPKATPVHPARQRYETALLQALTLRPQTPALGVCLGMQMMALAAGGTLDQHLPETLPTHEVHWANSVHPVHAEPRSGSPILLANARVTSHHRQAVRDPGAMRVIARSQDGVIEAIDHPGARFFLGVQWHPERTDDPALGQGIFSQLVAAAREASSGQA